MSLPSPAPLRGGVPMQMDPRELQAIDAPLVALTNQCGGDLRKLLFCFFSFLNRRTDFYLVPPVDDFVEGVAKMGFPEGDAEKLLLAAFRQFPLHRIPQKKAAPASSSTTTVKKDKVASNEVEKDKNDTKVASTKEVGKDVKQPAEVEKVPESNSSKAVAEPAKKPEEVRLTEEGLQIPVGNGGSTKRYKWTQTIDECTVLIGIPGDLRAKELSVEIKASSVVVRTKKPPEGESEVRTFIEGDLTDKAVPDESTWSLEGGVMVIQLYKQHKTFWKTVVHGDEEIDTTLVDSRRRIGEYDESTQAQIRKIMFDQNQARLGLPVSAPAESSGGKPKIPPLPAGVEYIDQDILDEKTGYNKR